MPAGCRSGRNPKRVYAKGKGADHLSDVRTPGWMYIQPTGGLGSARLLALIRCVPKVGRVLLPRAAAAAGLGHVSQLSTEGRINQANENK